LLNVKPVILRVLGTFSRRCGIEVCKKLHITERTAKQNTQNANFGNVCSEYLNLLINIIFIVCFNFILQKLQSQLLPMPLKYTLSQKNVPTLQGYRSKL